MSPLNRPLHYILDGHETVPVPDVLTWGRWFETADRRVAETFVGPVRVSTVFLGLDHAFPGLGRSTGDPTPLVFETMAFDQDGHELEMRRYTTWEEAEAGHAEVVAQVEQDS